MRFLFGVCALSIVMAAPRDSTAEPMNKTARRSLRAELVATAAGPKQCVATVLQILQKKGLLNDPELGGPHERRELTNASQAHAKAETPYGRVVQTIALDMVDGSSFAWEIIHPFAFLYYLTSKCPRFAELMATSIQGAIAKTLTLLLYGDDMTPGNPLRVDQGRKLFAFYYGFLEWPAWMLHRQDTWLCFGALRVQLIERVLGGVSAVFAAIIRLMFVTGPANFTSGFFIVYKGAHNMCRACFKGIIADEKGLKEAFDIRGQAGTKPCISCQNMFNFIHKDEGREEDDYKLGLDNVIR